MSALPSDAIERFRADVEALWRAADLTWSGRRRIALAVSGGPDSMAMLALTASTCPEFIVGTVDHQLRSTSAAEAEMVAQACTTIGVAHVTLHPDAPVTGNSLQMRAREARYAVLTRWAAAEGVDALLTAHHADDQAETMLMRLNRASGITGLTGIRSSRDENGVTLLRPLLAWRRAELRAIAETSGLSFVDDPSNEDERHDRTRIRRLLADRPELDARAFAASGRWLLDAEEGLAFYAQREWEQRWNGRAATLSDLNVLPREITRRLVRRAIAEIRDRNGIVLPSFDEGSNIEPLLDAIDALSGATHGGVQAVWRDPAWHFRPAPPRRSH